jgi:hypothetical protein
MVKKGILFTLTIFTLYLVINQTVYSKVEKPEVRFELADKTIPYKISNYSWGKVLNKEKLGSKNIFQEAVGTNAINGEYVHIHFSKKPENVEILEHKTNTKNYIYAKDSKGYAFQLDTEKGERIFEVRGIWKGNNYITYIIKLKVG